MLATSIFVFGSLGYIFNSDGVVSVINLCHRLKYAPVVECAHDIASGGACRNSYVVNESLGFGLYNRYSSPFSHYVVFGVCAVMQLLSISTFLNIRPVFATSIFVGCSFGYVVVSDGVVSIINLLHGSKAPTIHFTHDVASGSSFGNSYIIYKSLSFGAYRYTFPSSNNIILAVATVFNIGTIGLNLYIIPTGSSSIFVLHSSSSSGYSDSVVSVIYFGHLLVAPAIHFTGNEATGSTFGNGYVIGQTCFGLGLGISG